MKLLKTIADVASITRDTILGLAELPALHSLALEATDRRVGENARALTHEALVHYDEEHRFKLEDTERERDELKAQLAAEQQIVKKLSDALRGAEDYLGNFEMENLERIGNVEFLYIRDALKCLRGTDCL